MDSETIPPDLAAILACALSLWQECELQGRNDAELNFSEAYNGADQFMREVMRVATLFEEWACSHINFDELNEVWPYTLQDRFGEACLAVVPPTTLESFNEFDCLRVALRLRFPVIQHAI